MPVKTLPGLYELISGETDLATQIRPVQVEDVLGREPVEVDLEVERVVSRRTRRCSSPAPAARSAPSSAARSRASGPQRLILVDQGETALFEIERELVDERGFAAVRSRCSPTCKSRTKMRQVFERYRPSVVFHAAAYKHVPLMEANPLESVRNNVLGDAGRSPRSRSSSARERFVLVSTDKAVNPKTVMGQSKALCEWIVEAYGAREDIATRFVAVRFGNVLGSSGSVIPIFRRQIAKRRARHASPTRR